MDSREQLRAHVQSFFVEGEDFDTYVLPVGTELFKGYNDDLSKLGYDRVSRIKENSFFGFNEETSRIYGYAFAYRTTRTYTLLALDSIKTIKYLWLMADPNVDSDDDSDDDHVVDPEIRNILKRNYGFKTEYFESDYLNDKKLPQIRDSNEKNDSKFVDFLCDNGFQGYAINFMAEPIPDSFFHPECVICKTSGIELNDDDYNVNGIIGLATPDEFHSSIVSKVNEKKMVKMDNNNKKDRRRDSSGYRGENGSPELKKYLSRLDFAGNNASDDEENIGAGAYTSSNSSKYEENIGAGAYATPSRDDEYKNASSGIIEKRILFSENDDDEKEGGRRKKQRRTKRKNKRKAKKSRKRNRKSSHIPRH